MPFPASRNISWRRKCRIPDHPSAFAPVDVCFRLLPDVGDTEADDSGPFRVRECPLHAVSRPGVFSGSRLPRCLTGSFTPRSGCRKPIFCLILRRI